MARSKRIADLIYCGSEGLGVTDVLGALRLGCPGLPDWPQLAGRTVVPTFLGRVAVWQLCQLWRLGPGDEILLPAYNCGAEIDPFVVAGCKVVLYRVGTDTRIDVADIIRRKTPRTKVVYVIHYFGWPQDLRSLSQWCKQEGLRLVEDCALALFSYGPEGHLGCRGDAAIFSLGKFLATPGGGLLTLDREDPATIPVLDRAPRLRTLSSIWRLFRKDTQRIAERLGLYPIFRRARRWMTRPAGRTLPRDRPDMPASYYFQSRIANARAPRLALRLSRAVDPELVRRKRRENFETLLAEIDHITTTPPLLRELPQGTCPFSFPLITSNRAQLVAELNSLGINAYPFWEGYHRACSWDEFPEARFLKDNVLTLPVNQSLSGKHMQFVCQMLRDVAGAVASEVLQQ